MRPRLAKIVLAEDSQAWAELGFVVDDGACVIGTTVVRLTGATCGGGIAAWGLAGAIVEDEAIDGLTTRAVEATTEVPGASHPNGVVAVDHVVVTTPDLPRTCAALARTGLEVRRTRDAGTPERPLRQAFLLLADALIEVVGPFEPARDDAGPAAFWGLTLVVADIDAAAALLGDRLGTVRDAVQPGRRIATVRPSAGVQTRLALITPRVAAPSDRP